MPVTFYYSDDCFSMYQVLTWPSVSASNILKGVEIILGWGGRRGSSLKLCQSKSINNTENTTIILRTFQ